ncbi:hypothetical protein AAMO2058_000633300 [Amorphochlora amoebiformis]
MRLEALGMLAFFAVWSSGRPSRVEDELLAKEFDDWAVKHGKAYPTEEEWARKFDVWKQNRQHIMQENSKNQSHYLEMNHFGDFTEEEFRAQILNQLFPPYVPPKASKRAHSNKTKPDFTLPPPGILASPGMAGESRDSKGWIGWVWSITSFLMFGGGEERLLGTPRATKLETTGLPETVDWEIAGATSVPIMQGPCGSCYAFASVGAIEALEFQQTGYLIPRSVQQMVACSYKTGNAGCTGGQFAPAFKYAMKHPICQSEALHYNLDTGDPLPSQTDLQCRDGVRISGYSVVPENDELQLMAAGNLKTYRPLEISGGLWKTLKKLWKTLKKL